MAMFTLLLYAGAVALVIVAALLFSEPIRREILQLSRMMAVILLGVVVSGASFFITTQRFSGTGTQTAYGYPKPFYFTWVSWEQPISQQGFEALYFVGNTLAYASTFALVLLLYVLARHRLSRGRVR